MCLSTSLAQTAENRRTFNSFSWRRECRKATDCKSDCSNDGTCNEETDGRVSRGIESWLREEVRSARWVNKKFVLSAQSHVSFSVQLLLPLTDTAKYNQGANKRAHNTVKVTHGVGNLETLIQLRPIFVWCKFQLLRLFRPFQCLFTSVVKQGRKHRFIDLERMCCWDRDRSQTKLIFFLICVSEKKSFLCQDVWKVCVLLKIGPICILETMGQKNWS